MKVRLLPSLQNPYHWVGDKKKKLVYNGGTTEKEATMARSRVAEVPEPDLSLGEDSVDQAEETELESPESNVSTTEFEEDENSPFGEWSAETASDKPIQVILYGPPGGGKTWYAATFPKPLFLDLENGLRSTLSLGPVLRYPKNPNKKITKLAQVEEFLRLVYSDPNPKYETIVIDSLQELQILVTNAHPLLVSIAYFSFLYPPGP